MRERLLDVLRDVCPDLDFTRETSLIEDGLLESLDVVSIVTGIMDEFDVDIVVDDLLPENFNSVDAMLALIESKM